MAFEMLSQWLASMEYRTNTKKTAQMFDECLQVILEQGETLEGALSRYPRHAQLLRPQLEAELSAALWLREGGVALEPPAERLREARARVMGGLQPRRQPWHLRLHGWLQGFTLNFTRAQFGANVLLVMLLLATVWYGAHGSLQAARTSLPGDAFYPLKIGVENTRLLLMPGAAGKARLHAEFASQRLMELQSLVFEGRYEPIPDTVTAYEGHVSEAVQAVLAVSGYDAQAAFELALAYQDVTASQIELVLLLARINPGLASSQFERVRLASQNGATELRELLPSSSG